MMEFKAVTDRLNSIAPSLNTESRRLFHGRGQTYQNLHYLSIDWFQPAVFITIFEDIGPSKEAELVNVVRVSIDACKVIYIQRRYLPKPKFNLIWGEQVPTLTAKRGDLAFLLNVNHQNVGYFLDIEPARTWLQEHCADKRVLNLFSFTCTFSVLASHYGASGVVNMDLSSKSLETGRRNYALNDLATENVRFFANDILKSWGRIKKHGPYDIVIVDPPSFQKGSFIATKDYAKVVRRLESFTSESAKVLLCLNSPEVKSSEFTDAVTQHLDSFRIERCLEANQDFPDAEPERALKMVVLNREP